MTTITDDALTFGELLRRARRHRGLQGKQLAAMAGISAVYLSRLENGAARPSSEMAVDLARILGASPTALLRAAECLSPSVLALLRDEPTEATA